MQKELVNNINNINNNNNMNTNANTNIEKVVSDLLVDQPTFVELVYNLIDEFLFTLSVFISNV